MPNKARYLDDRRIHIVDSPEFTPFCELALEPGPFVVIAKGTVRTAGAESNRPIRLRLEVFGIHEPTPTCDRRDGVVHRSRGATYPARLP
jgi:hypothetical protein